MLDQKQWTLANAQFQALRKNLPGYIGEGLVAEYHNILNVFETASGESLSTFRISASELAPRITSFRLGSRRRAGSSTYSREQYCNTDYFNRQIEGLAAYLPSLQADTPTTGSSKDHGDSTNRASDRAVQPPQTTHHSLHIGHVTGSIIQQSPSHSPATLTYQVSDVENIVSRIKAAMVELPLTNTEKSELDIEVRTLELQLSSRNPKQAIMAECLRSTRSLLEGAAGSLIASGIIYEISKLLGN